MKRRFGMVAVAVIGITITATSTIPNRLFMTWKSKDLPTEPMTARQYWDNWGTRNRNLTA
jgi:hypothetical protein